MTVTVSASDNMIIEIGSVLVHSDILTEHFFCDLEKCHGECCVSGDAGAPVTLDEVAQIEAVMDEVWSDLSASAQAVIDRQGVAYADVEGEMVTSIIGSRDCVFTRHEGGCCYCALERAYRQGRTSFCKPVSCALYPIREVRLPIGIGLNYHRWAICKAAVEEGHRRGIPLYKFLREPLIRRFGQEWYSLLEIAAEEFSRVGGGDGH